MPLRTYGIVYATVSKMHRRTIADDHGQVSLGKDPQGRDAIICTQANGAKVYNLIAPGETGLIKTLGPTVSTAADPYDWFAAIKAATGVDPPNLQCALIENNVVTGVIHADPAVDAPPDQRLMVLCYSPRIGVGCSYDPATGLFSTPPGVYPPHTPGNSTDQPIDVPPQVIPKP